MPITAGVWDFLCPSVAPNTSVQLVPAQNDRRFIMVQNNSNAPIALNFKGNVITSLTPSATNPVFILDHVLGNNIWMASYEVVPRGAIICYHSQAGTLNNILVVNCV